MILFGEPHSTGSLYKHVCRGSFPTVYMSAKGKALKTDYQWQAKSQFMGKKPLSKDIAIKIKIFFGTKRKSDWDNFHKLSMDALTGIVWEDDSQIRRATVELDYDKLTPRIELDIKEL